ncbi:hypothetical protein ACN47E_003834 [Coniothyrium glycines]
MRSMFTSIARCTTILALLATTQAVDKAAANPSCSVIKYDDSSFFSVVGVQGTGIHSRQELRELEKDPELWNIFLQAFSRFQAMDQREKISYYKIAGIHGAPFNSWDGVPATGNETLKGYCPHTSSMFGPWHRPYLALFEQVLHDRAVDVANEYPAGEARTRALAVANRVRLPYWDWAMDPPDSAEGVIPSCLRRPTVTVALPNGTTSTMANPLYRYDFHPLRYDDFSALSEFQFKNWNHTIRLPLDGYAANATSRDDVVNVRVGKQQPNLRDMLYKLLTIYQPFNEVSNKANGGSIGNFETLHDGLHNVFGLGHMGIVEVSAFDPVFWFHHCQMDRIIAMYQARYPDTWVEDSEQASGTFAVAKGLVLGTASPLSPFHMNALGDMWTSTTVRNWTSFGYTYPELAGSTSNDTLTASLNKLYKPRTSGLNNTNINVPTPGGDVSDTTTQATDWLCEIHMPTDIKISYSVRVFLGEPNADPINWPTDPNYVGQLASMSSPRMNSSVIVTGNVVLTDMLAKKKASGELKGLSKGEVQAYLKANFFWRIQALDFSEIPRNNPPAGLNVTVFSVPVLIPESDTEVPTWNGNVEYHAEIDGNPPVYNGPGPDGTNTTVPAADSGGSYNATAGEFRWNNTTNEESEQPTYVVHLTEHSTLYFTLKPSASTTSSAPATTSVSSSIQVVTQAPEPTPSAGPQTRYITSIIMQYVTV